MTDRELVSEDFYTGRYWTKVRKTKVWYHSQYRDTEYTNLDRLITKWLIPFSIITMSLLIVILCKVWQLTILLAK